MALEDLAINIGLTVSGESQLDSLIGKLEALDALDPVEVDVELDVDDDDINSKVASAVSDRKSIGDQYGTFDTSNIGGLDFDNLEIDVPDTIDDFRDLSFNPIAGDDGGVSSSGLGFDDIRSIEHELGESFDPRGMINNELTIEDMLSGSDTDIFGVSESGVDSLIDSGRSDRGVENFFDFDRTDLSPSELFGLQESDSDAFATEMEKVFQTPKEQTIARRSGNPLTVFFDNLLGRDRRTGKNISGMGILGKFDNLNMGQLYTAIAQVVPLLGTFVAALPAVIAGVVGLGAAAISAAGALAAVGGLALMGGALALGDGNLQQGLTEIREIVKEDILGAIEPLASRFDDLFMDALNGFEEFMEAIASQGVVLTRMKDDARALGQFIMDFVPPALSALTMMGEAFTPIFAMFGDWLASGFDDFLKGLVGATRRALPYIMLLADSFIMMLPLIFDLSMGFLMVTTIIIRLIGAFAAILDWMGPLGTTLGVVIGGTLALVSVTALLYHTVMMLLPALEILGMTTLASYASAMWSSMVATIGFAGSVVVATVAVVTLLGVLTFGIAPLLGFISKEFLGLSSNIDSATKSLKDFENMKGGLSGMGMGSSPTGGLSRGAADGMIYQDNSVTKVEAPDDASPNNMRRLARKIGFEDSMFSNF